VSFTFVCLVLCFVAKSTEHQWIVEVWIHSIKKFKYILSKSQKLLIYICWYQYAHKPYTRTRIPIPVLEPIPVLVDFSIRIRVQVDIYIPIPVLVLYDNCKTNHELYLYAYWGFRKNRSIDVGVTSSPKFSLYTNIQRLIWKIFIALDNGKAGFHGPFVIIAD
jgi:hypothetical protein